ncbi:hypothetical protein [Mesopusillimonas faecipullorum]|uniref:hypothetical protein n=1 Tax=Mesopusillimonas faecipullorum TaxID=2755040 RepID=UPI001D0206B0|nr:hypothetical protein [Mesopusillimonas faecipullorum]
MTKKKQTVPIGRSSAAEYLTYIAATGGQPQSVEMRYEDENIWLTQKMMAALYDVTVPAINQHLKRVFDDGELLPEAVIKDYLITASDGKNYRAKVPVFTPTGRSLQGQYAETSSCTQQSIRYRANPY